MTVFRVRVPHTGVLDVTELAGFVRRALPVQPFAEESVEACAALSQAIFEDPRARRVPELQSLAFWCRRSEIKKLAQEHARQSTSRTLLVPAGVVVHFAPSNVDTIFVYSWLLSTLVGNVNVVRVSTRPSIQTDILCDLMSRVLADRPDAHRTRVVTFDHDAELTRSFCELADVRVLWGGDRTVQTIRAFPISPSARDVVFPDRYSLAVAHAARYLAAPESDRATLVQRFYNDSFWFDQMGCSSPRALVWVGKDQECEEAASLFFTTLRDVIAQRSYVAHTATALQKMLFSDRAIIDGRAHSITWYSNELAVVRVASLEGLVREHCGGGLFLHCSIRALNDLGPLAQRKDQTLAHFGFDEEELMGLARVLNGRGVDRMVPFGEALAFNRYWDGLDLLEALSRRVYVQAQPEGIR
jgi:hypothetical protein